MRAEMVDEKGLAADVADRIGHYVKFHGIMLFVLVIITLLHLLCARFLS